MIKQKSNFSWLPGGQYHRSQYGLESWKKRITTKGNTYIFFPVFSNSFAMIQYPFLIKWWRLLLNHYSSQKECEFFWVMFYLLLARGLKNGCAFSSWCLGYVANIGRQFSEIKKVTKINKSEFILVIPLGE